MYFGLNPRVMLNPKAVHTKGHGTPIHQNPQATGKPLMPSASAAVRPQSTHSSLAANPFQAMHSQPTSCCKPRQANNRGLYTTTAGDTFQRHSAQTQQAPLSGLQQWLAPLGWFTR